MAFRIRKPSQESFFALNAIPLYSYAIPLGLDPGISAITTCTQSERLSRLYPNFRLPSSGGSHSKYVLVRSYRSTSKSAWNRSAPQLAQKREQRGFVRDEQVQAAIEIVGLDERDVLAQQVAHCAMLEPMPMQSPLAAGRNQLIGDQGLQHVQPVGSLARGRQRRAPEIVQSQLVPQHHRQPAGAPLTWAAQPHLAQPNRNHVAIENRRDPILGKQRDLCRLPAFVEHLDRSAPRRPLAVVDLPEIEHLSLNYAPTLGTPVLDDRPGPMHLAVFAANLMA